MAMLRIRKPDGSIVEIASLPGAKGEDGKDGKDGADGYTPIKGVDYFTPEEQAAFTSDANSYTDEKTDEAVDVAKTYTDIKTDEAVDVANSYTDEKTAEAVESANSYTDERTAEAVKSANSYTDERTAPAGVGVLGTIKLSENHNADSQGFNISGEGTFVIHPATNELIDGRASRAPICPKNLDYAVKSVGDGYYALASDVGDVEAALDGIIAMQESLIGGDV